MEGDLRQKLLSKERRNDEDEEELSLAKRVWNESKLMWIVAAPAICTRFSTFGLNVISQSFIGHIGSRELAAFALVYTVLIRFANGVLVRFFLLRQTLSILFYFNYGYWKKLKKLGAFVVSSENVFLCFVLRCIKYSYIYILFDSFSCIGLERGRYVLVVKCVIHLIYIFITLKHRVFRT